MIHFIPEGEETLHKHDSDCKCDPIFDLDEKSGEMVWFHIPLTVGIPSPTNPAYTFEVNIDEETLRKRLSGRQ